MRQFDKLRVLRAFRKEHADFLGTQEDRHLISEIGYHQAKDQPLTLKQLFLLDIGSIATVQRRMRRLKSLGLVRHRQAESDRRSVELTLSPKCIRIFAQYDTLMSSKPAARVAVRENGEPRHRCGLCDSDAGRRNLLVAFLARGLKQGDRCVLVAPTAIQDQFLDGLPHRRRASEQLLVSEGHDSPEVQFAFLKHVALAAKKAGKRVCLGSDMTWALAKGARIEAILEIESRFDALAGRFPLTALCVYDTRRFTSGELLRAMKCHRDHLRHPVLLG